MVEKIKKPKIKKELFQYGSIIFGVGLLITLISSFFIFEESTTKIIITTQIILGVMIGIVNITKKDSVPFLIASGVLILIAAPIISIQTTGGLFNISLLQFMTQALFQDKATYEYFLRLILSFMPLIIPATVIVSLKTIFLITKDEK